MISALLSLTLIFGVMGVSAIAVFVLSPIFALLIGVLSVLSIAFGGGAIADTYHKLYEGKWHPNEVSGSYNGQATFAILSFALLIVLSLL